MILENIKIKNLFFRPFDFLRIFLALVFLTAGIFRIFNPTIAASEFITLGLPQFLTGPMIFLEIMAGLALMFNKFTKPVYILLVIFLVFALLLAVVKDGASLLAAAGELFIFNINPTDWFLHLIFLFGVLTLLLNRKSN